MAYFCAFLTIFDKSARDYRKKRVITQQSKYVIPSSLTYDILFDVFAVVSEQEKLMRNQKAGGSIPLSGILKSMTCDDFTLNICYVSNN